NLTPQVYTVTVTDANSCTTTATATITQPPALTLTATQTNISCNGLSTGSATATVSGGTGPSYTVGIMNPPQGGTTTATEVLTGLAAGSYTIGAQDANGCQDTISITITQPTALTASILTQSNVSCYGGTNGSATVTPGGGTTPYAYSWSPIGGIAAIGTNLSAGNYTATVSDSHSCTATATVAITQPPVFTASITAFTNDSCFGTHNGSATATQSGGTAPYTYSWSPSGGTATTATNLTAQVYTITITDTQTCTATATVTISQPPALTLTATSTSVTCNGLSNGSATATATGGTGSYTYGWNPPPAQISTTGVATGLAAGSHTAGVQDANGCQDTVSITIIQPAILTAATTQTNVTCFGLSNGSATATHTGGTGPSYTYSWVTSGGTSATASNLTAQPYTVTVSDANLCTATATLTITQPAILKDSITSSKNDSCFGNSNGSAVAGVRGGTAPYTYSWTPSGGTLATASGLPFGVYTATVKDSNNCVATTTVSITQPPVLTVSSTPKTICISNTTTLTALAVGGNTAQTYTYSIAGAISNTATVNPTTTTIYTLGVIDMKGCTATNTVTVFVRNPLSFLAVNPGKEKCQGFSATLNATGSGGDSTFTYTWYPGPIVGQNITVTPTVTTTYTLVLTDNCGTPSDTSKVTVTIDSLPKINFTADKQTGCYPLCVQFTSTTQVTSPITYFWNLGGGHSSTAANPYQCYTKAGTYSINVTALSDKGCLSHDTINNMITVYPHPVANFYYSPNPVNILEPTVQFNSTSSAPGSVISNLYWQTFGDGSDSSSILYNPAHTYQDTGNYGVQLIVTNGFGCKDSLLQYVHILPFFTLYIPNAFTPNDDGFNDMFYAIGEYVSTFDMKIFDRWGNLVYHTTNINADYGWNGSKAGAAAKEDVYVYLINATDVMHKPHSYNGTVTLIK
ncbi:MAG: PKD domain-containing protein, partial [Bacteroidia bacterium]